MDFHGAQIGRRNIHRRFPARIPKIDLENQRGMTAAIVDDELHGRVRNHAAVPIIFAVDFSRRKTRRQRRTGQNVLGGDLPLAIVKIDRCAGADIGGESGEPHRLRLGVDPVEIHQTRQRALQRSDVVVADRLRTFGRGVYRWKRARRKETRRSVHHGGKRADLVGPESRVTIAVPRQFSKPGHIGNPERRLGDGFPEIAQPLDPLVGRIARNQGSVDRADRGAAQPMHVDLGFMDGLVNAGLICAERAAALQNQRDALEREHARCAFNHEFGRGGLIHNVSCMSASFKQSATFRPPLLADNPPGFTRMYILPRRRPLMHRS